MSTPRSEKTATDGNQGGHFSNQHHAVNSAQSCAAHKWQRTLAALLQGPQNSFQLEKAPTFDHCPNSTVSELKKRHGLIIWTQMIRVRGYDNCGAHIAEYRLDAASRAKAEQLLGVGQ